MDQEIRWLTRYNEVKSFIKERHRNPSKYYPEEKLMVHFLKRGRKLMNAGAMPEERMRANQYELFLSCELELGSTSATGKPPHGPVITNTK